ncbi:Acetylxylan esterase [Lachnellula suecica]|uniref:Acetylxylan esterase n=1 Tax=Lachnellula suecica TaxID=602035 RepID=A0A8T9BVK5_9HELO|nr:Acetylxylan esterase [Lachnellula suecica]
MRFSPAIILPALALAAPAPEQLEKRVSCAPIHIFGARETTAPAGYGTTQSIVNTLIGQHSGATSEAIKYPACGGQASCGSVSYQSSQQQGTSDIESQVNSYAASCPSSKIVLLGYSQGGQITDQAYCGGGFSAAAYKAIKAVIFMGTPTYVHGLSYDVGTCQAQGFAARPVGYKCGHDSSIIKSYCDAADPYCCNGNDANTHQQYASKYGSQIVSFVNSKL